MKTKNLFFAFYCLFAFTRLNAQSVQFTYPADGVVFTGYDQVQFTWNATGNINSFLVLCYMDNSGVTISQIWQPYSFVIPNIPTNNGMFILMGETNTSSVYDTIHFSVVPFPTSTLNVDMGSNNITICGDATPDFVPTISGGTPPYTKVWTRSSLYGPDYYYKPLCNNCDSIIHYNQHTTATYLMEPYTVALAVTDANGLTGLDTVHINFHPHVGVWDTAFFSGLVPLDVPCGSTFNPHLTLSAGATPVAYHWYDHFTGTVVSDSLNPDLPALPGLSIYTLYITDQYGCNLEYDSIYHTTHCNTLPVLAEDDCFQLTNPDQISGGYAYFTMNVFLNDISDTAYPYQLKVITPPTVDSLIITEWNQWVAQTYPLGFPLVVRLSDLAVADSFQYVLINENSPNIYDTAWARINMPCNAPSGLVWPGDADNNGYVDNADLLPIGVGYGVNGIQRPGATINWTGQNCIDWNDSLPDNTNYKFIDCNGNGLINADDTTAIRQNFFMVHPRANDDWRSNAPALAIQIVQDTVANSDTLHAFITLGDNNTPASNVYGVAFDVNLDAHTVDSNYVSIRFGNSWLGNSTDLLSMSWYFPEEGLMKAAVTRYDHTSRSGSGPIATLEFLITTSNINGKNLDYYISRFSTSRITLIDQQGNPLTANPSFDSTILAFEPTGVNEIETATKIVLFPNPANGIVTIRSSGQTIDEVTVKDILGKQYLRQAGPRANNISIDVSNLISGIYTVEITTGKYKTVKRLAISK